MSKKFIAAVIRDAAGISGFAAETAAGDVIDAIIKEMKKRKGFTLQGFGTFKVVKTKARTARNPRTGEPIKVKAGKAVRFKASPTLKKAV